METCSCASRHTYKDARRGSYKWTIAVIEITGLMDNVALTAPCCCYFFLAELFFAGDLLVTGGT